MQQHYNQQMHAEQFEPFNPPAYPDYMAYEAGGVVQIPLSRAVGDRKKPNQASLGKCI